MKLDLILPEALRGMPYDEVKPSQKIGQYFELANLVLISSEAMIAHIKATDMTGASEANSAKVRLPFADLDYLRLRDEQGRLLPKQTEAVFSIVQAYWEGRQNLGLGPGLVASLWRRGMSTPDIIRSISASTGPDGRLIKPSGRGRDIMQVVIEAYLEMKSLPNDAELSVSEAGQLVERWLTATRSTPLDAAESGNSVLHWSDYRRLGLVNEAGHANLAQVRLITKKVFSINGQISFRALSAWIDKYHPPQPQPAKPNGQAVRALLKKKRKQGRVNRKRGRR
ncbi:hypothetical protein [Nioella sp. MMSF_3534]|uniref:hypothetical protein n=1 Tax=Nioella sp. MMSF_3534 TaxID=3046720 RepID=UPI00273DB369|nr:hypothetical protein [Nioella sp. MMSF_3534]